MLIRGPPSKSRKWDRLVGLGAHKTAPFRDTSYSALKRQYKLLIRKPIVAYRAPFNRSWALVIYESVGLRRQPTAE